MGLLEKLKAAFGKGKQAVDRVGGAARGIVSGDIDGIGRSSAPYAERLLTNAEKDLARQVFEETLPYGAIYLSNGLGLGQRPYTIPHPWMTLHHFPKQYNALRVLM